MEKVKEDDPVEMGGEASREAWRELEGQDPLLPLAQEPQLSKRARPTAYLDGLRGFAAFLVYMSHHVVWWYGAGGPMEEGFGYKGNYFFAALPFIRSFFAGGSAAVAIFFILSGYVLSVSPLKLLRDGKRTEMYRSLTSAFIRRPIRLYLPPLGVAFVFLLFMHLPLGLAPAMQWPAPLDNLFAELGKYFIESLHMMNPFEPHGVYERWFPYDPPVWTMAIEFRGSILVYSLLAAYSFAKPHYRTYLFSITGIFFLMIYSWSLACFCWGVALSINDMEGIDRSLLVFKRMHFSDRTKTILLNIMFFASWFVLCQPASTKEPARSYKTPGYRWLTTWIPSNYYDDEYWRFWNAIGACGLVYCVLKLKWLQRFFLRPSLQFLGRISFSFYLIHIPFLWTVGDRIYRLFGLTKGDMPMFYDGLIPIPDIGPRGFSLGFWLAQCIILPINFAIAEFATRMLDQPSIEAGKWVVTRLGLR